MHKKAFILLTFTLLPLLGGAASKPTHEAAQLVQQTTNEVISRIKAERETFVEDQTKLFELVDEAVIPHFDFDRMSKWVLGRHWRGATEEQRERFKEQFKTLLVRTYATALTQYSDQEVEFLAVRERDQGEEVQVRTEVRQGGGRAIPINYNMHRTDGAWQVYDVIIEGVSLVSNYRSSFAGQIRAHGLDRLISMLSERNTSLVQ